MSRLLSLLVVAGCTAAPTPHPAPQPLELVVSEDFDDRASLQRFEFSDPAVWAWHPDGALELRGGSAYVPPHRSPLGMALLSSPTFDDFVLEVDLLQTGREYGHRDLCLFLGYVDAAHFDYVHLATTPDERAHNLFAVDGADRLARLPVLAAGVDWGDGQWHHVRLERLDGRVRVFFDDLQRPILTFDDPQPRTGRVGLGSFDDSGRIDNLRIWTR